jgi:hypothetical protein
MRFTHVFVGAGLKPTHGFGTLHEGGFETRPYVKKEDDHGSTKMLQACGCHTG